MVQTAPSLHDLSADPLGLLNDASAASSPLRPPQALPTSWANEPLPSAWPDQPRNCLRLLWWLLRTPFGRPASAELPRELPLARPIPDYAREAFHGMPNGYYSLDVVEGYDRGFELVMLGCVQSARKRVVRKMAGARRALDVGCGSGRLAQTLAGAGVPEVWGIDPSPYMLQRALRRTPGAHFTQGLIEDTTFPSGYFDAAGACFLFHELPADIAKRALRELGRILRPGGLLCITDPCPDHLAPTSRWRLLRDHGWRGLYFHALAHLVYEPFLQDWRAIRDHRAWFDAEGFELVEHHVALPVATFVAKKR